MASKKQAVTGFTWPRGFIPQYRVTKDLQAYVTHVKIYSDAIALFETRPARVGKDTIQVRVRHVFPGEMVGVYSHRKTGDRWERIDSVILTIFDARVLLDGLDRVYVSIYKDSVNIEYFTPSGARHETTSEGSVFAAVEAPYTDWASNPEHGGYEDIVHE